MRVRYTYRLRPGRTAQLWLLREAGMCRWVWNQLVAESKRLHLNDPACTFGAAAQDKFLTGLRSTTADDAGDLWLAEGSSVAQQQTVRDFASARVKALHDRKARLPMGRRKGLPRFKKRGLARPSMNFTLRGFSLKPDLDTDVLRLVLPGKTSIPVVWSRVLPAPPTSVRVSQDSCGDWWASFVVDAETEQLLAPAEPEVAIGIDWGVTETATTARVNLTTGELDIGTGYDLPHSQHGKTAAAALAKTQKAMARRRRPKGQPKSDGYLAAQRATARTSRKLARQRQDDARKWARRLVADHQLIAVEDFKPRFLASSTMARKAADAAIGAAKAELIWQAVKHGRDLRLVSPAHTTMDCSTCGARATHRVPLGQRIYTCEHCGVVLARDKNSAIVMIARAGFDPADADGTRPEPAAVRATAA